MINMCIVRRVKMYNITKDINIIYKRNDVSKIYFFNWACLCNLLGLITSLYAYFRFNNTQRSYYYEKEAFCGAKHLQI